MVKQGYTRMFLNLYLAWKKKSGREDIFSQINFVFFDQLKMF